MTLNVASILNKNFDVAFADFASNSVYLNHIRKDFPTAPIIQMKSYTSSSKIKLLKWFLEVVYALIFSFVNLKKVVSIVGTREVLTYATDKKLLYMFIFCRKYMVFLLFFMLIL